jgi:hypothetical protein
MKWNDVKHTNDYLFRPFLFLFFYLPAIYFHHISFFFFLNIRQFNIFILFQKKRREKGRRKDGTLGKRVNGKFKKIKKKTILNF